MTAPDTPRAYPWERLTPWPDGSLVPSDAGPFCTHDAAAAALDAARVSLAAIKQDESELLRAYDDAHADRERLKGELDAAREAGAEMLNSYEDERDEREAQAVLAARYKRERNETLAELNRLKAGGCARDQGLTQHCAEAVAAVKDRDEARAIVRALVSDLDRLDARVTMDSLRRARALLAKAAPTQPKERPGPPAWLVAEHDRREDIKRLREENR